MTSMFTGFKRLASVLRYSIKFWLGLLVLVFGLTAFLTNSANVRPTNEPRSPGEAIYQTFQLFILETGVEDFNSWPLEIARLAALALFVTTVIGLLTRMFQESYDSFRLRFLSNHTIVCGLGKTGQQIVDDAIREADKKRKWYHFSEWALPGVVVIEKDASKDRLRQLRHRGGLVIAGDATHEDIVQSAGVLKAKRIVISTGRDQDNAKIVFDCINLMRSADTSGRVSSDLKCLVQIADPTVFQLFNSRVEQFIVDLPIDLKVFNLAAISARKMIKSDALALRPTKRNEVGLYVLIGFGKVGQSVAVQLAELAHFENGKRPRMLIVENNIVEMASRFTAQFGTFTHDDPIEEDWDEVTFEDADDNWESRNRRPVNAERVDSPGVEYLCNARFVESPKHFSDRGFVDMLHRVTSARNVKPIVFVCRDENRENFDIAGLLADLLDARRSTPLSIFTWLPGQPALRAALESSRPEADSGCRAMPFRSSGESVSLASLVDEEIESIAERLHADYQEKYCQDRNGVCANWGQLSELYRQSNRIAAVHALIKLHVAQSMRPDPESESQEEAVVELLAEMEHNRWLAGELLAGWRYGPEKSDAKLIRPTIKPWSMIPEDERAKDRTQVQKVLDIF